MQLVQQRREAGDWIAELRAGSRNERTLSVYAEGLLRLSRTFKKPFKKLTKQDLVMYLGSFENMSYKNLQGFILKSFLRWLYRSEDPPTVIRWWKPRQDLKTIMPESLLTPTEIKDLLAKTPSIRDRCLLSVLYDSGCRVGEILPLRRENVSFSDLGATIICTGKTGRRRLLLANSAPILRDVMNSIPTNPDVNIWTGAAGKQLDDSTVRRIAKQAGERIKRSVHPHLLRHCRASHLALKMSEVGMRARFGWTAGSNMTKRYVHLSGRQLDDEFLEAEGIKRPSREEDNHQLTPVSCPVCGLANDPSFSYCSKCSSSLLPGLGHDLEKFTEQIQRLMTDPVLDESVKKFAELDKAGVYGPHLKQEADFLTALAKISQRQVYIMRLLANKPPPEVIPQKSESEIREWAKAELANIKRQSKPRKPRTRS
jgi:integrase